MLLGVKSSVSCAAQQHHFKEEDIEETSNEACYVDGQNPKFPVAKM